MTYNLVAEW